MIASFKSPIGVISIEENDGKIVKIALGAKVGGEFSGAALEAKKQLEEYFRGERRVFSLPLAPEGTDFQRAVWKELVKIPYGETRSYGFVAAALGKSGAVRAVGNANGANPIIIVIPCHRVIASGGKIGGYSYGIDVKRRLLEIEGAKIR